MRDEIALIETIRRTLPGCIIVGDSTQLIYAGNFYGDCDRVRGWFNAATGYGALGYGPPAAIGAALAAPDAPVVCIVGDGGLQFTMAELGTAVDEGTSVIFLVWNNDGYREIETYMLERGIAPIGVAPSPPDFALLARAYGMTATRLGAVSDLAQALTAAALRSEPALIEIHESIIGA